MGISEEYTERRYRGVMEPEGLTCYEVARGESDLYVCTVGDRSDTAKESLETHRQELEEYLGKHLSFGTSFRPVPITSDAPDIVLAMGKAAEVFDVGPMASVAGAIAQYVGTDLLLCSPEVIVENGGDIFLGGAGKRKVRIFSGGQAPGLDVVVAMQRCGAGLCTSSATVGPSVSLGQSDAVTVFAPTAILADAAASAIGNVVVTAEDIKPALEWAREFDEIMGVVIVVEGNVGAWGEIELA